MRQQSIAQCVQAGDAHVDRQRLPFLGERAPVERVERILAVGSDQAQRLRVVAMGQRNAGIGGAGQRGGDSGHDFVADAVRAQEFQFLAAPAEHERITALQAHHAPSGARVFQQEGVDAFLGGVVLARVLGDFDEFGIAPGEPQDVRADQAVVQDHVGLVEQAQGAQGQQPRITRASADQGDAARTIHRRCRREGRIQRRVGSDGLALPQQVRNRAGKQFVEEDATFARLRKVRADSFTRAGQQPGEVAQRRIEFAFEPFAQVPRQHRRAAATGDRNLQRAAFDPRGNVEMRARCIVHHVHQHLARLAFGGDGLVDALIVGGGDRQPGAVEPRGRELAIDVVDLAARDESLQGFIEVGRADPDPGARFKQRRDFACRDRTAAHHQHAAAAQVDEYGKQRGSHGVANGQRGARP